MPTKKPSVVDYLRLALEANKRIAKKKKKKKHSMDSTRFGKTKGFHPQCPEALAIPETEGDASAIDDYNSDSSHESIPGHRDYAGFVTAEPDSSHEGGSFKQEENDNVGEILAVRDPDRNINGQNYAQDDPDVAATAEFNHDNPAKDPDYEGNVSKRSRRNSSQSTVSRTPRAITEGERMMPPCGRCCRAMASMKASDGSRQVKWTCFKTPGGARCSSCKQRGGGSCLVHYTQSETETIQRWADKFLEFEKDPSDKLEAEALALGTYAIDEIPTGKEFARRRSMWVDMRRSSKKSPHKTTGSACGSPRKPLRSSSLWSPRKPLSSALSPRKSIRSPLLGSSRNSTRASRSPRKQSDTTLLSSDGREQTELLRRILDASEKQAAVVGEIKGLLARIADALEKK